MAPGSIVSENDAVGPLMEHEIYVQVSHEYDHQPQDFIEAIEHSLLWVVLLSATGATVANAN